MLFGFRLRNTLKTINFRLHQAHREILRNRRKRFNPNNDELRQADAKKQ